MKTSEEFAALENDNTREADEGGFAKPFIQPEKETIPKKQGNAVEEITVKLNADVSGLDTAIEKAKQLVSLLQEVKNLAASLHVGLSLTT